MVCIDELNYEILLSKGTYKECSTFIRKNFKEIYTIEPGFKIFDVFIIGIPPIYVALDNDSIIFPYTKPCHGTYVLSIHSTEDVLKLKKSAKPARRS